jgi:hypothetical protein
MKCIWRNIRVYKLLKNLIMKKYLIISLILLMSISCKKKDKQNELFENNVDLTKGLVAYYPFNGNANDESGNGNNGTVAGAELAPDRFGNENRAYLFDGVSKYIIVKNSSSLQITKQITMSVWFKTNLSNYVTGIIVKANPTEPRSGYMTGIFDYDKLRVDVMYDHSAGKHGTIVTQNAVTDNSWHHSLTVYDGKVEQLYLDGRLETQISYTDGILNNDEPLVIGWDQSSVFRFFNGEIDDIRIYNRVLNVEEINALYLLK